MVGGWRLVVGGWWLVVGGHGLSLFWSTCLSFSHLLRSVLVCSRRVRFALNIFVLFSFFSFLY